MKTLFRSTLLLCLSIFFGTTVSAEPVPAKTPTQPSLTGTWSTTAMGEEGIIIFNNAGEVKLIKSKAYGDYKYYEFFDADYSGLFRQIGKGKFVVESYIKYKVQGDLLEVTSFDGRVEKNRLDFTNNGRTLNFRDEKGSKDSQPIFTMKRVSDSTELPKETESLATVKGHFHGLQKLIALQTAQADYWGQKRRFASQLQSLKINPLPESDRLYRFELVKQGPRETVVAAIPTELNLRSYILQLDRIGRRQQPFAGILCATDRPSAQQPPLPQLKNKKFVCPTKTHQIDIGYPIRGSLFKLP